MKMDPRKVELRDQAMKLVEEFAKKGEPIEMGPGPFDEFDGPATWQCEMCYGQGITHGAPIQHGENCLWRRAREITDAMARIKTEPVDPITDVLARIKNEPSKRSTRPLASRCRVCGHLRESHKLDGRCKTIASIQTRESECVTGQCACNCWVDAGCVCLDSG